MPRGTDKKQHLHGSSVRPGNEHEGNKHEENKHGGMNTKEGTRRNGQEGTNKGRRTRGKEHEGNKHEENKHGGTGMEQQMNYITGVYWREQKQSSVVLQQVVRKDGVPILLMCIINRNDNPNPIDHSPVDHSLVDHSLVDHSPVDHSPVDHSLVEHSPVDHSPVDQSPIDHSVKSLAREISDWFYTTVLSICRKGNAEKCTDRVMKIFEDKIFAEEIFAEEITPQKHLLKKTSEPGRSNELSGIGLFFAMGEQCFYFWKGNVGIQLYQIYIGHIKGRMLSYKTEKMEIVRGELEAGIGILLANQEFWENIDEKSLEMCLAPQTLYTPGQVGKHLEELARGIERANQSLPTLLLLLTK